MKHKARMARRMLARSERKPGSLRMGSFLGVRGMLEGIFASRSWGFRRVEKAKALKRRQEASRARAMMRREGKSTLEERQEASRKRREKWEADRPKRLAKRSAYRSAHKFTKVRVSAEA